MKVTRPGDPSRLQLYRTTCWRCHCEFQFDKNDADIEDRGLSDVSIKVNCPSCNTRLLGRMPMQPVVAV